MSGADFTEGVVNRADQQITSNAGATGGAKKLNAEATAGVGGVQYTPEELEVMKSMGLTQQGNTWGKMKNGQFQPVSNTQVKSMIQAKQKSNENMAKAKEVGKQIGGGLGSGFTQGVVDHADRNRPTPGADALDEQSERHIESEARLNAEGDLRSNRSKVDPTAQGGRDAMAESTSKNNQIVSQINADAGSAAAQMAALNVASATPYVQEARKRQDALTNEATQAHDAADLNGQMAVYERGQAGEMRQQREDVDQHNQQLDQAQDATETVTEETTTETPPTPPQETPPSQEIPPPQEEPAKVEEDANKRVLNAVHGVDPEKKEELIAMGKKAYMTTFQAGKDTSDAWVEFCNAVVAANGSRPKNSIKSADHTVDAATGTLNTKQTSAYVGAKGDIDPSDLRIKTVHRLISDYRLKRTKAKTQSILNNITRRF